MNWLTFFAGMGTLPLLALFFAGLAWAAGEFKPDYKTPIMPESDAIAALKKQNENLKSWLHHLNADADKDAKRSVLWEGKFRIVKAENNTLRKKLKDPRP